MADKKNKKCKKILVETVVCDPETGSNDIDEMKTVDIATNSRKIMKYMRNYIDKAIKKRKNNE